MTMLHGRHIGGAQNRCVLLGALPRDSFPCNSPTDPIGVEHKPFLQSLAGTAWGLRKCLKATTCISSLFLKKKIPIWGHKSISSINVHVML